MDTLDWQKAIEQTVTSSSVLVSFKRGGQSLCFNDRFWFYLVECDISIVIKKKKKSTVAIYRCCH